MKGADGCWAWTSSDTEYLGKNYYSKTLKQIASDLGTTKNVIDRKARELGLRKKTIEDIVRGVHGIEDMMSYLQKAHWEEMLTVQKISKALGVSRKAIYGVMEKYNIPARNMSESQQLWWDSATEEERRNQYAAAHAKCGELMRQGEHAFQKAWREKPEKMRKIAAENALKMCKNRKRNGMTGKTGEKHHGWDPNRTKENRIKFRKTAESYAWVRAVYEKDNYICQVCGYNKGGTLNAHHLNSYADCEKLRHEVSNGITLCGTCHKAFHAQHGWGKNTKEQFEQFVAGEGASLFI